MLFMQNKNKTAAHDNDNNNNNKKQYNRVESKTEIYHMINLWLSEREQYASSANGLNVLFHIYYIYIYISISAYENILSMHNVYVCICSYKYIKIVLYHYRASLRQSPFLFRYKNYVCVFEYIYLFWCQTLFVISINSSVQ